MYQFGKEKGSDGAEQGAGSEVGQTQMDGAGYAVPSFGSPNPRAAWRIDRRIRQKVLGCSVSRAQDLNGETEGAGLICPGKTEVRDWSLPAQQLQR